MKLIALCTRFYRMNVRGSTHLFLSFQLSPSLHSQCPLEIYGSGLFVRLAQGVDLDDELTSAIKLKIRTGASPRHVPAVVVAVEDIPRTKSGKITELAVRDIVHGRTVKNREALANPEALELFRNIPELQS